MRWPTIHDISVAQYLPCQMLVMKWMLMMQPALSLAMNPTADLSPLLAESLASIHHHLQHFGR